MSAQDYYKASANDSNHYNQSNNYYSHGYDERPPAPPSPSSKPTLPQLNTTSPTNNNGDHSQSRPYMTGYPSSSSDVYGSGGIGGRNDHTNQEYADNIPLKQSAGPPAPDPYYGHPNTQYPPPSPESQMPPHGYQHRPNRGSMAQKAFRGRMPWVVYIATTAQVGVFIGEIIKNALLTGSPIEIHPSFNIMIGPSPYVMINMGSRFVACMHNLTATEDVTAWPCPNTTSTSDVSCTLSQLCGFGANTGNDAPNQWYRFIIPMFLHAGVIHIGFNMLLQMSLGREIEKLIGSLRFALVYFSSGIFGFVLGGNYAATGISSTGASGCLFGILALSLLDLLYSWRERVNPGKELMFLMLDIVISFVLGLLPGLDNFSHIGGFLMGLILGVCLLHSPNALRQRIGEVPYQPMQSSSVKVGGTARAIRERGPVGFFKGRKPLWWAWWLIRAAALITVVVVFIMLLNNFYVYRNTCSWCKYLSCLPIKNWCDIGNLETSNSTSTSSKRALDALTSVNLAAHIFD